MILLFLFPLIGLLVTVNVILNRGHLSVSELLVTIVILFLLIAGVMRFLSKDRLPRRLLCETNLKGLGTALATYVDDYDGNLPTESWCDLLIEKMDVDPRAFKCYGDDDFRIGESSYAMNENAVEKKLSELPTDMVLLFETDFGKRPEKS